MLSEGVSNAGVCYAVMGFVRSRSCASSPFGLCTSGWGCLLLQCQWYTKANSTLNMSLLRLSHAKRKKKGEGREEVGKLLRRQISPVCDALMVIHSEGASCLSAYTGFLLCLSVFAGLFFSLILLPSALLLVSSLCLSYLLLLCFFFLPVYQVLCTAVL